MELAKSLEKSFKAECVMVIGSTPLNRRAKAVKAFQEDLSIKLFIGNIQAAGTGITLTASSHVVFAEISWVPGEIIQAYDRLRRIGQKYSVFIQYLVLKASMEARMIKTFVYKQAIIEKALDRDPSLREMLR